MEKKQLGFGVFMPLVQDTEVENAQSTKPCSCYWDRALQEEEHLWAGTEGSQDNSVWKGTQEALDILLLKAGLALRSGQLAQGLIQLGLEHLLEWRQHSHCLPGLTGGCGGRETADMAPFQKGINDLCG